MWVHGYEDSHLPDYYDTMYLDGYTPEQIMEAHHRTMMKQYMARKAEQEKVESIKIKSEVKIK